MNIVLMLTRKPKTCLAMILTFQIDVKLKHQKCQVQFWFIQNYGWYAFKWMIITTLLRYGLHPIMIALLTFSLDQLFIRIYTIHFLAWINIPKKLKLIMIKNTQENRGVSIHLSFLIFSEEYRLLLTGWRFYICICAVCERWVMLESVSFI